MGPSLKTKIFVHDANVLIDLEKGGLLGVWVRRGFVFVTSDFVVHELKNVSLPCGLEIMELTSEELAAVFDSLETLGRRISVSDASVLYLAKKHSGVLLTGDRLLRSKAESQKIEVHGVLGVLECLIRDSVLSRVDAANALRKMLQAGARLPKAECDKRLFEWQR